MLDGADATGAPCMERVTSPPFGLRGGKPGAAAVITLTRRPRDPRPAEQGRVDAPAGSVIKMVMPGPGGFGPAAERDPRRFGRDLLDGYVTAAVAGAALRRAALDWCAICHYSNDRWHTTRYTTNGKQPDAPKRGTWTLPRGG
jgi:mono/diheme cytochrome c family protein